MAVNPVEAGGSESDSAQRHIHPKFPEILDMSIQLGHQIAQYCQDTGERIDRIAVLPRGALYLAMVFSRMFDIEAPELVNMSMTSYKKGKTSSDGKFRYGQMPTAEEVEGLVWLLPDDVIDSGWTEYNANRYLLSKGAKRVIMVSLYDKVDMHEVDIKPDFCVIWIRGDVWIHFPWEDDIENLLAEPEVFSGNYYEQKLGSIAKGAVLLDPDNH